MVIGKIQLKRKSELKLLAENLRIVAFYYWNNLLTKEIPDKDLG